jgi:hypothetical protein
MELVRGLAAAIFAVSDLFDFVFVEGVEIIEFEISVANSTVTECILELFATLDFLLRDHVKTEDFHKSPPS